MRNTIGAPHVSTCARLMQDNLHLLLYVVYMCQKSKKLVDAFICYKQKCKVAPYNLAHPVVFYSSNSVKIGST